MARVEDTARDAATAGIEVAETIIETSSQRHRLGLRPKSRA